MLHLTSWMTTLPITDSPEILLLHFPGMHQGNRLVHLFPVLL